jgi:hypothetical protein
MDEYDWGHWAPPIGIDKLPDDAFGFLYKITDKASDKFYVGIKQALSKRRLPALKGKKRKRIVIKESDWREYCSSSGEISESVKANKDDYSFEILSFHPSKSSLKYAEAEFLIKNDCFFDDKCHNQMLNLRVNCKHLRK